VKKVLIFSPQFPRIDVEYEVSTRGGEAIECLFGSEWNVTLIDGHHPHKFYEASGISGESCFLDSEGVAESKEFRLVDDTLGFRLSFDFPVPARIWRRPLYTVSQSEKGLGKSYQGSALVFHWPIRCVPNEVWRGKIEVSFQEED
jgi:alpha-amylase